MKKSYLLTAVAVLSCLLSQAQVVFDDNLSSYNNANLSGQGTWSNSSSQAGLGACAGAICTNSQVGSRNMSYTGYGSTSKAVQFGSDMDAPGTFYTPITSGVVYYAFLINVTSAPSTTSSNDFFRVSSGNNFNTTFRIFLKAASGSSFFIGVTKGASSNPAVFSQNGYAFGQDHLVVVKYEQAAGAADDTVTVYVDPSPTPMEPSTAALVNFTGTDQAGSIDRMVLRCNGSSLPVGYISAFKIVRQWSDFFGIFSAGESVKKNVQLQTAELLQGRLQFALDSPIRNAQLKVYDLKGAVVTQQQWSLLDNNPVQVNPIAQQGVYILELYADGEKVLTQKVMAH